jgi:predicted nucleic acid-binding protein
VIVLDTNVVSEPLRPTPEQRVVRWIRDHRAQAVVTSITVGELLYGVQRLPEGRRKRGLLRAVGDLVESVPVIPYGPDEAAAYAGLRAAREAVGLVGSVEDLMIAGSCLVGRHRLASRNVKDFVGTGVDVVNPWAED